MVTLQQDFVSHALAVKLINDLSNYSFNQELPSIILKRYGIELGRIFSNTQGLIKHFSQDLLSVSKNFDCDLLIYLRENLTPRHFTSDKKFLAQKDIIFKPNPTPCDNDDKEIDSDFYQDCNNLTELGKLCVQTELKRLEITYNKAYKFIYGTNKIKLEHDAFLALYLYTTNLGYKKINSQLRFGHENNCKTIIGLINRGIDRLSKFEQHQLDFTQHKLVRYLNLPVNLLDKIVSDVQQANVYLDKAFLSTSFNHSGADAFKENSNLEIVIKSNGSCVGTKLDVEIDDVKYSLSPFPEEGEYLLPPGTRLHITIPKNLTKNDPNHPIRYDPYAKKATLVAAVMNFKSFAISTMSALKAAVRFKRSISTPVRSTDHDLCTTPCLTTEQQESSEQLTSTTLAPIHLGGRTSHVAGSHVARGASEPAPVSRTDEVITLQTSTNKILRRPSLPMIILGARLPITSTQKVTHHHPKVGSSVLKPIMSIAQSRKYRESRQRLLQTTETNTPAKEITQVDLDLRIFGRQFKHL